MVEGKKELCIASDFWEVSGRGDLEDSRIEYVWNEVG